MHRPETWGFIQFSDRKAGSGNENFLTSEDEQLKWALRQIYYAQQQWKKQHQKYSNNLSELNYPKIPIKGYVFNPQLQCTQTLFEVTTKSIDGKYNWHISQDGLIWKD
jgi:D-mannonate dehydratase